MQAARLAWRTAATLAAQLRSPLLSAATAAGPRLVTYRVFAPLSTAATPARVVLSVSAVATSAAAAALAAPLPTAHTIAALPDASIASQHAARVRNPALSTSDAQTTVSGWVRTCRGQKNDVFVNVNDGTNVAGMQLLISEALAPADTVAAARALTAGAAVTASGALVRNPRQTDEAAADAFELHVSTLTVWGKCPADAAAAAAQVGVPVEAVSSIASDAADAAAAASNKSNKKSKSKSKQADAEADAAAAAAALAVPAVTVCEVPITPYPLQKKVQTLPFLRSYPHLRLRTNTYGAVFRIRSEASYFLHEHFRSAGFSQVHAPTITPLDCEGAGELFSLVTPSAHASNSTATTVTEASCASFVPSSNARLTVTAEDDVSALAVTTSAAAPVSQTEFFGTNAYMSVSGQLYGEIAASAVKKVFSFGPTYRAEPSLTSRHLAEFWMLEPEVAFADLAAACTMCEASIQSVIRALLHTCADELAFQEARHRPGLVAQLQAVVDTAFARVTYTEAVEILTQAQKDGKETFSFPVAWGLSLQAEHERYLAEAHFRAPVFVTNYPAALKPFYMRVDDAPAQPSASVVVAPNDAEGKSPSAADSTAAASARTDFRTVACFDLLVPGMGELCGGSQREERYSMLLSRMAESGMKTRDYAWYADLRRFGTVPHAGWGMGFERFVAFVAGMESVRDTTLVPRAAGLMQM